MFPWIPNRTRLAVPGEQTNVSMVRVFGATETAEVITLKASYGSLTRLPHRRGLLTLTIDGLPTLTDDTLPVILADGIMTKPLLLASGAQMTGAEFTNGEHIVFCYDKSAGTIRITSSETVPAAADGGGGGGA